MARAIRNILLSAVLLIAGLNVKGIASTHGKRNATVLWKEISRYFSPPAEFRNKFGDYRSPLKFYDGKPVNTPEQWKKRREEIFDRWMGMMGEWPPFIKHQKMEILSSKRRDGFMQYRIRFYWLPNQKTTGYLLVPFGKGKRPAVITVFYTPETAILKYDKKSRNFAYELARRGFVTLSLGTTKTTKAGTYSLYYPDRKDSKIQPISVLAYAAANAWYLLAENPHVDSTRIGIMGFSYGGKWAMFASCLFQKFACAVWVDPGLVFSHSNWPLINYWEPWYLGYYPPPWHDTWRKRGMVPGARGLYPKLRKEGYDLQELQALMAPRPFLVSGGRADGPKRWLVLNYAAEVDSLLGYSDRVAMTYRKTHIPTKESDIAAYRFLEYFLECQGTLQRKHQ